jgi:hypothetical protein
MFKQKDGVATPFIPGPESFAQFTISEEDTQKGRKAYEGPCLGSRRRHAATRVRRHSTLPSIVVYFLRCCGLCPEKREVSAFIIIANDCLSVTGLLNLPFLKSC